MSPPEFEDDRTFFRVTFSNDTMLDDLTVEWLNRFSALNLTDEQRLALAYTLHQQEIANGTFRRLTGSDSRETTSLLHDLVRKDLLVQEGTRRWATYRLSQRAAQAVEDGHSEVIAEESKLPPQLHQRMTPAQRQEKIYQLIASRGSILSAFTQR